MLALNERLDSADGIWIRMVPYGYYIDGCNPGLDGGVVKMTKTRAYSTCQDEEGLWAIERRIRDGFGKHSVERFETALDAAIALKKGGLNFTCFFINDIYLETCNA